MINHFEKLPKELQAIYKTSQKSSPDIESLKVAAALKLWHDRSFRDIQFEVPLTFGDKTVFVKVLAKNEEGVTFGVECASTVRIDRLRKRAELLHGCLPPNSYLIAVFPTNTDKQAEKATELFNEVWLTGKSGAIEQMMFTSVFHKE